MPNQYATTHIVSIRGYRQPLSLKIINADRQAKIIRTFWSPQHVTRGFRQALPEITGRNKDEALDPGYRPALVDYTRCCSSIIMSS
jgi:hypothetical protein